MAAFPGACLAAVASTLARTARDARVRVTGGVLAWQDADVGLVLDVGGPADAGAHVPREWLRDVARLAGNKALVTLDASGGFVTAKHGAKGALRVADNSGPRDVPVPALPAGPWRAQRAADFAKGGAYAVLASVASADVHRPIFGVLVTSEGVAYATDGTKLANRAVPAWGDAPVLVPSNVLAIACKLASVTDTRHVHVTTTRDGTLAWLHGTAPGCTWTLYTKTRPANEYPAVDAVQAQTNGLDADVSVDADDLRAMWHVYRGDRADGRIAVFRDGTLLAWSSTMEAGFGSTVTAPPAEPPAVILGCANLAALMRSKALPTTGAVPLRYASAASNTTPVTLAGETLMPCNVEVPPWVLSDVREAFDA